MEEPKKTCLHDLHLKAGAKMSPFGGFDMPIEYSGLDNEHRAVRNAVGVFDVSHMGEVLVSGPQAESFVNYIFTNDIRTLSPGEIQYGMMCRPDGGVIDDLLVYKVAAHRFLLVINAGNIDKDQQWILDQAKNFDIKVELLSDQYGELAIQGPQAAEVLSEVFGLATDDLRFYTFKEIKDAANGSMPVYVSRTGYTGEDGFEIYADHTLTRYMWNVLMENGVTPCGLGCRDTLRFEAGLPLYGDELAEDITPLEAGLGTFVKLDKDDFIGRDALAAQKAGGVPRKVVGLKIDSPATARHGFEVLDNDGNVIGHITTGYNTISVEGNYAMALIDATHAALDTPVQVRIRRKIAPAIVVKKRFYTPKYKK